MKAFNIKEYLKNPSRKVVTRDGQNIKIHCTNFMGLQSIIGQIEGYAFSTSFSEDGRYAIDRDDSHLDLFFAPEKYEGWANVFKSSKGNNVITSDIFESKEEAEKAGKNYNNYIATAKVEWEE